MQQLNKPTIEAMINTTAILLTGAGATQAIDGEWWGVFLIGIGFVLEFFKYWGRKMEFW